MRIKLLAPAVSLLLLIASSADAHGTGTHASSSDFVQKASESDLFEITTSKVALQNSQDAGVQHLAKRMIKDHTQSSHNLMTALEASDVDDSPAEHLNPEH